MKRIFFILVLLGLGLLLTPLKAEKMYVMAFDDWPPFTGKDGRPRVAVQLLTAAMERLGHKVDIMTLRSGEFPRVFTDPVIDMSPALWYNKEREKQVVYSDPIFENRLVLVGLIGSGAAHLSLKDLAGKTLGVVDGYAYGDTLTNAPATLVLGGSEEENIKKMLMGEIDFVLTSELLLTYASRRHVEAFKNRVEIGVQPQITKQIYFAVKKTVPGAKDLVKDLNKEIQAMIQDGSYYEILGINRIVKDINGDGIPEILLMGDPASTLNPEEIYRGFGEGDVVDTDMQQWFMVDGKFYKTLEEIPEAQRKKMAQTAKKQIEFDLE